MFCEVLVKKETKEPKKSLFSDLFLWCGQHPEQNENNYISFKSLDQRRWKIYILFKITVKFLIRADSEYFPFV